MTSSDAKRTDRPSLRKAGDSDVHPSTPSVEDKDPSFLRRGRNAADSVGGPDRDRNVVLKVEVPKSLRKSVRAEAKRRGMTVDHLVAEALRERNVR